MFLIQQAKATDIHEIMRIENESFAPQIRETETVFLDRISAFPEGCFVLRVKPESSDLAGYLTSEIWDTVPAFSSDCWNLGHSAHERHNKQGTVLYISSFAVEKASRGKTGGSFFSAALEKLVPLNAHLEKIVFIVHEDWLPARRIYEKEGFAYTGQLRSFFYDNKDALIMEKHV